MRHNFILSLVLALFVLPLTVRAQAAGGPVQPDAGNFRIDLLDGSFVKGTMAFVMDLDSQYGKITITSANMLSAKFDVKNQSADVRTRDIEMQVKFKPATSDLKVMSNVGPLNIDLAQVSSILTAMGQPAAVPAAVGSLPTAAQQAAAQANDQSDDQSPSVTYNQQPVLVVAPPQPVINQFPSSNQFRSGGPAACYAPPRGGNRAGPSVRTIQPIGIHKWHR